MTTTILASAARTASGSAAVSSPYIGGAVSGVFLLSVSAAASTAADLLDVYLQGSVDGGTTYDDFVHFTQVAGNGGVVSYRASWSGLLAPTTPEGAPQDAALGAGSVAQGPAGTIWRVKWVVVDDSGSASFTFGVEAGLHVDKRRAMR